MRGVVFNPSKSPTVGVEVEAQIVDNTTGDLVNIAENIVNGFNNEDRVKHELYLSTVEITSSPALDTNNTCLLYTSPSPRDATLSRMPSSA